MAVKWMRVAVNPRDFLYISNILSLSRIALLPIIIFGLTKDTNTYKIFTLTVAIAAMITDILDGFLARRLKQESALGKILDPFADKFCIGSVAIAVTILHEFPWWAMGSIIFRDTGIIVCGLLMVERWTVITSSNIWGKSTSLFQSISIVAYAFRLPYKSYLLVVALVLTGISAMSYATEFRHLIKAKNKRDNQK
jgi:CDP-diacylglycerol--glycerol-3-phosphate 3-phosphatidyltransferase